jgi:hypothetical protein
VLFAPCLDGGSAPLIAFSDANGSHREFGIVGDSLPFHSLFGGDTSLESVTSRGTSVLDVGGDEGMWRSATRRRGTHTVCSAKFRSVAFIGASLSLLLAAPAEAGSQDEERHCVAFLVPIAPKTDDGVISATLEEGGCFPTLEEALEAGTGAQLALPVGTSPAELNSWLFDLPVTALASVLLGTEYDSTGFAGGSTNYFASSGCAGTTWQVSNVGAGVNDTFESGKGFGACDHNRKFEHVDFGGAVVLCTPNCSTYGTLRNEVTSLRWAD